jgi:hypothetical protein
VRLGERSHFKEVKTGVSYQSQRSLDLLFGLDGREVAQDVVIRWPSGELQKLGDVPTGTRLTVVEGVGPVGPGVPGAASVPDVPSGPGVAPEDAAGDR